MSEPDHFAFTLNTDIQTLSTFLLRPMNLRLWTVHRDLYWIDDACWEATSTESKTNYACIMVSERNLMNSGKAVTYTWMCSGKMLKQFEFKLHALSASSCSVATQFAEHLSPLQRNTLMQLLDIEFNILQSLLCKQPSTVTFEQADFLQRYRQALSVHS